MVIGILSDLSQAEGVLNNLVEAEFNENTISLVSTNSKETSHIHESAGPFKHTSAKSLAETLHKHGLPKDNAQQYEDSVQSGKIFIAIDCEEVAQDAACEMLTDAGAVSVQTLT